MYRALAGTVQAKTRIGYKTCVVQSNILSQSFSNKLGSTAMYAVSTTSVKDINTQGLQMLLMFMATKSEVSDAGSGHFKICEIVVQDCSGECRSLVMMAIVL